MSQDDMMRDFLDQAAGKKPRSYPQGRLGPEDDGELAVAISADKEHNKIVVRFAVAISWVALTPEGAIEFGNKLIEMAGKLNETPRDNRQS